MPDTHTVLRQDCAADLAGFSGWLWWFEHRENLLRRPSADAHSRESNATRTPPFPATRIKSVLPRR